MGLIRNFLNELEPHVDRALRLVSSQMPGVLITRKNRPSMSRQPGKNEDLPYLWRYYFRDKTAEESHQSEMKASRFGVFLHQFVNSDAFYEVHNHPWTWCLSIIWTAGYTEHRCVWDYMYRDGEKITEYVRLSDFQEKVHLPFSINFIRHSDMHRVVLKNGPVWTLFIHGPRVSTWGFAEIATGKYREIKRRTASFIKQGIV